MAELLEMLVGYLQEMPDDEFEAQLKKGNFLKEVEPLLFLVPEEMLSEVKKIKFAEVRKLMEKEAPEKAQIVSKKKKWEELEKTFEKLKKTL
ncbi:MAG: hypothetical protein V1847_03500 [Candidatus Diapherotrites archaeon]